MIKLDALSTAAYNTAKYDLLKKVEGSEFLPYADTAGIPTIGVGFNLRVHLDVVAREILGANYNTTLVSRLNTEVQKTYTPNSASSLQANLNAVMQNWHNTHSNAPTTFRFTSDQQAVNVLDKIDAQYEQVINSKVPNMAESEERAVLFSLAYNSANLIGNNLKSDIINNERAEAWWEIRYQSNADTVQANRRYVEANRFELYDDHANVQKAEADKVAAMYTLHRDFILNYEKSYSPTQAAIVKAESGIQEIYQELQPAIEALKKHYNIPSSNSYEEVLLANSSKTNLSGDGTNYDSDKNDQDLLIGDQNVNVLKGGTGNDALIGNGGNDTLSGEAGDDFIDGGAGNDSLVGGADKDTYIFSSGSDTIDDTGEGDKIEGYSGVAISVDEENNIFDLNGIKITHVESNNTLILEKGIDQLTMLNWVDGDYGITLEKNGKSDEDVEGGVEQIWDHPSPIALDIDKSGKIETVALNNSKVYFDIDNDNFTENVQWISKTDGWLAMDRNANGKIDNQAELFGDNGGTTAYQKLAALNTNKSGSSANAITSVDADWSKLRVWIDSNSNGVSEASELKTLASLNITSLSLESAPGSLKSTFIRDGVTYNAQDIFLQTNQLDSWYKGTVAEIKPEALSLPLSRGYGDVKSLHYSISSSTSLMSKVQGLDTMTLAGLDGWYTKLEAMIEEWTGTASVTRNTIHPLVDARHIAIMEKFSGLGAGSYMNSFDPGFTNFNVSHFINLEQGYGKVISEFSSRFISQGPLAAVFGNPVYSFGQDKLLFSISHTQILTNAKASIPTDTTDKNVYWSEIARTLLEYSSEFGTTTTAMQTAVNAAAGYTVRVNQPWEIYITGTSGNDSIVGNSKTIYIDGAAGNDTLRGNAIDNHIIGGDGADLIYGGSGNDTILDETGITNIFGDAGNDSIKGSGNGGSINGGIGDDTINGGNGQETIYGGDGNDTITDEKGITNIFGDAGNDSIKGSADGGNINGGSGNDTINGGNGHETLRGGNGNDQLNGNGGNNVIYGDAGDDTLFGGSGNSTLVGGTGNDSFKGGAGNETYQYTLGHGDDTIAKADSTGTSDVLVLTNMIRSNVTFTAVLDYNSNASYPQEPNSVKLSFAGGGSILLAKHLDLNTTGRITTLRFSDNTTMSAAQIVEATAIMGTNNNDTVNGTTSADMMLGAAGNDSLSAGSGNDTIFGQTGSDILRGGLGNDLLVGGNDADTYRYARGDGNDTISDYSTIANTQDVLILENITRNEVSFVSVDTNTDGTADSVNIVINGGGSVLLTQQLSLSQYYTMDSVCFSDGTVVTAAQMVTTTPITGTSGNDTISGNSNNNLINAGAGADEVSGYGGNDTLNGEDGNDRLWGDLGNDSLSGGLGSDSLSGNEGTDIIKGDAGDDHLWGNDDNDTLYGGADHDRISGNIGLDVIYGDTGNDSMWGNEDTDILNGGDGNDYVEGNAGEDSLFGNAGDDALWGSDDDDVLNGGAGKDSMTGGYGYDTFAFSSNTDSTKTISDIIWDFDPGIWGMDDTGDKIKVTGLGYTRLDTDEGNTEAGELRFYISGDTTIITSDQTNFAIKLDGVYDGDILTNADFIWA